MRDAAGFENARVEPLADQSKQHPVANPSLEKVAVAAVIDRIASAKTEGALARYRQLSS